MPLQDEKIGFLFLVRKEGNLYYPANAAARALFKGKWKVNGGQRLKDVEIAARDFAWGEGPATLAVVKAYL